MAIAKNPNANFLFFDIALTLTRNMRSCDGGYAHRFFLNSAGAVLTVLVLVHA